MAVSLPMPLPQQFVACIAAQTIAVEEVLTRSAGGEPGNALSTRQLRCILLHIERNLDGDLSLAVLAGLLGLSPSHFARRFKISVGDAPHQYVLARRVNAAKRLLLEGNLPLAEIAAAAGFSSQAHLTGIFGRLVGMTPGAYRTRRNQCLTLLAMGRNKDDLEQAA